MHRAWISAGLVGLMSEMGLGRAKTVLKAVSYRAGTRASQATIAAISGLIPTMFMARVRLWARTERARSTKQPGRRASRKMESRPCAMRAIFSPSPAIRPRTKRVVNSPTESRENHNSGSVLTRQGQNAKSRSATGVSGLSPAPNIKRLMSTRPPVMGRMMSSLPSDRRAAELMLLSVVNAEAATEASIRPRLFHFRSAPDSRHLDERRISSVRGRFGEGHTPHDPAFILAQKQGYNAYCDRLDS